MSEMYLTRTVSGLQPANVQAQEALRKIKLGKMVRCEITTPRNIQHHRKFFALLQTVWMAAGDWPSVEDLLIELKFKMGVVREVVLRQTGEVVKIPDSISFAAMDQEAFDKFYERAIQALCFIAGGIEADALRQEVLNQLAAA